mmetsp:Transcript_55370/g.109779  ORF Transcript_55370/g.109779 Transcript_55370/m.109779 type:complete len:85 (-) Transcript_55370:1396-1650(-)
MWTTTSTDMQDGFEGQEDEVANPPPAKRSRIGESWTASTASTSSSRGTQKIWCAGSDCSEELQQRTDVFEAIQCGCVFQECEEA